MSTYDRQRGRDTNKLIIPSEISRIGRLISNSALPQEILEHLFALRQWGGTQIARSAIVWSFIFADRTPCI